MPATFISSDYNKVSFGRAPTDADFYGPTYDGMTVFDIPTATEYLRSKGVWAPVNNTVPPVLAAATVVPRSGGGQASATQLAAGISLITSSVGTAAPFDSVKLPAATPSVVYVVNTSANPIQVFGSGTDTINGTGATGITQPPNSVEMFVCSVAGTWNVDPGVGFSGQLMTLLTNSAVTPFNGGGQASAVLLTAEVNRVTSSVATAAPFDSVKLPVSAPGLDIVVINASANPIQVFGSGTDTINGLAAATGMTQAPSSVEVYFCPAAGVWTCDPGIGFSGQLFTELAQDNITAAGTTQATAVQLWAQTNRVNTAAATVAPFNGVLLPASAPGLEILVINHAPNSIQVYGSGADTIDDVAAATGVTQMTNSFVIYSCATAGKWYTNGIGTGFSSQFPTVSFLNGITATAAGTQATAVLLQNVINRVTTVASAGDAVKLPVSAGGLQITVTNTSATNAMNVFPNTGDAINGAAVNTAFSIPATKTAQFSCAVPGQWHSVLSA